MDYSGSPLVACVSCVPANTELSVKVSVMRGSARFKVARVEISQCVVGITVHGACLTVQILKHHPRNELRCKGDHKCLGGKRERKKKNLKISARNEINHTKHKPTTNMNFVSS